MIDNVKIYSKQKEIGLQDAMQVFLQVVVLKNLHLEGVRLIGGTSLVMGSHNPRFSEDIDLTNLTDIRLLSPHLLNAKKEVEAFLGGKVTIRPPKRGTATWKMLYNTPDGLPIRLHVDSQPFAALSGHALVIEFPGIAPFIFPSVEVAEILADKLVALTLRKNLSGRDIFDLWYHWLKEENYKESTPQVTDFLKKKLIQRSVSQEGFNRLIHSRLKDTPPARVVDEWNRYLPAGLKNKVFYGEIFKAVTDFIAGFSL